MAGKRDEFDKRGAKMRREDYDTNGIHVESQETRINTLELFLSAGIRPELLTLMLAEYQNQSPEKVGQAFIKDNILKRTEFDARLESTMEKVCSDPRTEAQKKLAELWNLAGGEDIAKRENLTDIVNRLYKSDPKAGQLLVETYGKVVLEMYANSKGSEKGEEIKKET